MKPVSRIEYIPLIITTSKSVMPEPPAPERNLPAIASPIELESPLKKISPLFNMTLLITTYVMRHPTEKKKYAA